MALDVLADVTSQYLLNVGRTIRFLSDKFGKAMTPEVRQYICCPRFDHVNADPCRKLSCIPSLKAVRQRFRILNGISKTILSGMALVWANWRRSWLVPIVKRYVLFGVER